jgi:hypothetical protein
MADEQQEDLNLYGVVEIMGHRTRAGILTDAQMGGATFLRIEHPTDPNQVEMYGAQAIFGIRPCTRDEAIRIAAWSWKTEAERTLSALASVGVGDHDDDWDDDHG